ncbi:MAG: hypothetical protein QOC94_1361 [Actinoplanes sp.]|jgi:hypothetical protein|nr:hypothetical protein [Actinoplanes sp.]
MSEHGWPDFHDDGLHHDDDGHDVSPQHDPLHHDPLHHDDDSGYFEDQHHDDLLAHDLSEHGAGEHGAGGVHEAEDSHETHEAVEHHEDVPGQPDDQDDLAGHELQTVGADPDALPEPDAGQALTLFPPVLDVGALPEPVDGFPWIDTGSLGLIDPVSVHAAAGTEVSPQDLADYAGTQLPPGVDPWAALADSDDPATSALAKWWSEHS